ncbi:hypothetical protein HH310_05735 [Actinoplanes sp. TBRC 11911]|uniref:phosphopantetheine-binding protein n=1 Tax=Actinoplanes sp. TBRC 11911 TaxID=2729386 RepID=UPI00145DEF65|nr:phosphopantetheine-binding protein [Actinoplanes sp. TBRC 11911]NMO50695.1 hypothetical protein [Actinoplanes sp. TBRC 11911]
MDATDVPGLRETVLTAVRNIRPQAHPIADTTSFGDLGMDSLDRLVLAERVERATGLPVPDTILAAATNIGDLLAHLGDAMNTAGSGTPDSAERPALTALGMLDDGAIVGAGTRLWHQAQIAGGAQVGDDCTLGKGAYVGTGSTIGNRVKIGNYASIFGATVADNAMISPNAALLEDPAPRATTADGRRKQHTDYERRPVIIGASATVGAGALIAPGVTIGHDALVALGAVVVRDVAPHALVAGNPARQCGWVCVCGHTLTERHTCPHCPRRYTLHGDVLTQNPLSDNAG